MSAGKLKINIGGHVYLLSPEQINVTLSRKGMFDIIVKKVPISAITNEEWRNLMKVSHKNVQMIVQCLTEDDHHYLVAEISFNLADHLKNLRKKSFEISYQESLRLMKDITEGLAYLHKCQIVHKNLCPENVIVDNEVAKIASFGFVDSKIDEFFAAPEVNDGKFSTSSDVYSLGKLFFFIFFFKSVKESKSYITKLLDGRRPPPFSYLNNPDLIEKNFRTMCLLSIKNRMLTSEIEQRLNCESIKCHILFWDRFKIFEFLNDLKDDAELVKKIGFLKNNISQFDDKFYDIFPLEHVLSFMDDYYIELIELSESHQVRKNEDTNSNGFVKDEKQTKKNELHKIFLELGVPQNLIKSYEDIECDYSEESLCGEGISKVYRAIYKDQGNELKVAVKLTDKTKFNEVKREIKALCTQSRKGNNDHVIKFFGIYAHDLFYSLILELAIADLSKFINGKENEFRTYWSRISEKKILLDSAKGVDAIHANNFLHLDLKPENILIVNRDGDLRACIADFGRSKKPSNYLAATATKEMIGTLNWFSPEMKRFAETFSMKNSNPPDITSASDIYQLGLIFGYVLIDREFHIKKSNSGQSLSEKVDEVKSEMLSYYTKKNKNGYLAEILIERMIQNDPTKRLDALGVIRNPFFWTAEEIEKFLTNVRDNFRGHAANEQIVEEVRANAHMKVFGMRSWIELIENEVIKKEIMQWNQSRSSKLKGDSIFDFINFMLLVMQDCNERNFKATRSLTAAADSEEYFKFWIYKFGFLIPFMYYNIKLPNPIKNYYSIKIPNEPVEPQRFSVCNLSEELGVPKDFIKNQEDIECENSDKLLSGLGISKIFKGKYKGCAVAVKVINKTNIDDVKREIQALCKLATTGNEENVIRFFGVCANNLTYSLILEVALTDLQNFINGKEKKFKSYWSRISEKKILLDASKGVEAIHTNNLKHLDLKPENILIVDRNGKMKACVAGLGRNESYHLAAKEAKENKGSQKWLSPEMKRYAEQSKLETSPDFTSASDIYQLGLIFGFVLIDQEFHTKKGGMRIDFIKDSSDDYLAKYLIKAMTCDDPLKRLDASGVIRNPFFWRSETTEKFLKYFKEHFRSNIANKKNWEKVKQNAHKGVFFERDWIDLLQNKTIANEILQWNKCHPKQQINGESIFDLIDFILIVPQNANAKLFKETRNITSASNLEVYFKFWTFQFESLLSFTYYNTKLPLNEFYSATTPIIQATLPVPSNDEIEKKLAKKRDFRRTP